MPEFVYHMPAAQLAVLFSLLAVAAVIVAILVIKPILRLVFGTGPDFNQSLAFAASGFNLFYGLLLGLLVVAAYQNSEKIREAIQVEALTLGALYSDVETYPEPLRSELREMMRDYVLFTIHRDFPAHRDGAFLDGGSNRADGIRLLLASHEPQTEGQVIVHQEVISAFRDFDSARQKRLSGVLAEIPDILWYAVLVGAAVNVVLLSLIRMRPHTQFMIGTITTFFLGVILFVIVTLDAPLKGTSGLAPTPFALLWEREMRWDDPRA